MTSIIYNVIDKNGDEHWPFEISVDQPVPLMVGDMIEMDETPRDGSEMPVGGGHAHLQVLRVCHKFFKGMTGKMQYYSVVQIRVVEWIVNPKDSK